jgi:hypothetical protein
MTSKKPRVASRPRKVVLPENHYRRVAILFSDQRWRLIRATIPDQLSAEHEERLRNSISECCNRFLGRVRLLEEGAATAAAVRRGGGKQPAPLEQLVRALNTAAKAWAEIRTMHDDRRGVLSDYGDRLAAMAIDAERRLNAIKDLGQAKPIPVKHEFVRRLAECCRKIGLNPTATGRVSEHEEPTWFQKFVVMLNNQILGDHGWGLVESEHKARAAHSDIAKALIGYAKQGNPRK